MECRLSTHPVHPPLLHAPLQQLPNSNLENFEDPGVGRLDAAYVEIFPVLFLQRVRELRITTDVRI